MCSDQGTKVGRDLLREVLDSQDEGVPYVQEGAASCDPAGEVHQDRRGTADQHQGEDSSGSEAAGGSSYYVVGAAPFVQVGGSICFEVGAGRRVQVGDSYYSAVEILVLVGGSYCGEGFVLG